MNNNTAAIELLFDKAEDYSKTSLELIKLNAIDKTADVASSMLAQLAVSIVAGLFVFSVNIALGLFLGELMKMYLGFFALSAFYLVVATMVYQFRNEWFKQPIQNAIISQILNQPKV